MPFLEMRNITKSFSGVYANEDVSLTVERQEIHALLGENGAGKTTLMNILFGIYHADRGEILLDGEVVRFPSPREAIAHGIGMVHQHFSLIKPMTVLDNVILGLKSHGILADRKSARINIRSLAEKYGLFVDPDARVCDLSVGEQQRVEILKALYRNVKLLILDEPTGVLTPQETENFFQVLRKLKAEGYGIIIITHRLSEIMAISDKVTILRDGRMVKELVTAESDSKELSAYMIGRELKEDSGERVQTTGGSGLELDNISFLKRHGAKKSLDHICLSIKQGEILGIAGVEGNGQKELAEIIAGIRRHTEGTIRFWGEDIGNDGVKERFEKGISYISDDRHGDSLVLDMSVTENLILREYRTSDYGDHGILNYKKAENRAATALEEYRIKTSGKSGIKTPVKLMSGGNQQKIILSREISQHARLVVASQPTRGLDIGATEFVHETLLRQRNENRCVLLISADLDEIMALSDRIAVMFEGRIAGILDRKEADVNQIGLLMGGVSEAKEEGTA